MLIQGMYEKINTDMSFDWRLHKDNFPNYLYVIITPDGVVKYACPDHKTAMEAIAGVTDKDCPRAYWCSMIDWLTNLTGCIAVYTDYYRCEANERQLKTLQHLKSVGIFAGKLL